MEDSYSTLIHPKSFPYNNEESEIKNSIDEAAETIERKNALETINNFNTEHEKEHKSKDEEGHSTLCTNIRDIDWLGNIFIDKDIKNMLIQNSHIKEILVDEALYYFYIFSKIFLAWTHDKEREKLKKEAEKEREKDKDKSKYYHMNLPPIDMKEIEKKIVIPKIKVGIVGCGNIGKKLLKSFIKIKDKKIFDFQIQVSTRQPDKIMSEFLDILDEDITIMLNNEKLFEECDIIFLCVQPNQLDLLSREVFASFNERVEKLQRKEYKCFPFVISFLSATTINRLEMFFPRRVHIVRTRLLHNFLRAKKKALFSGGGGSLEEDGEYIDESCDHLLSKEKSLEFIESLIKGLTEQFYTETIVQQKKGNDYKNKKNVDKPIQESPLFLFEIIFGKELAAKYYDSYKYRKGKFIIPGLRETLGETEGNKGEGKGGEEEKKDTEENNIEINQEAAKIQQEFTKNIANDFKKIYINYLEKMLKKKK